MRLVLFNRDLRVTDNTALIEAIDGETPVIAAFVATPEQWKSHSLSPIQADLIWRRLTVLQSELKQINVPLIYQEAQDYAAANTWLAEICHQFDVQEVFLNRDYEINEANRIQELSEIAGTEWRVRAFDDKCILKPGSVLNQKGDYFKVFTPFKKAWLKIVGEFIVRKPQVSALVTAPANLLFDSSSSFSYPTRDSSGWSVDSHEIIQQLRDFSADKANLYHAERDFPALDSTSMLSPYLAIGAISARQCVARLKYDAANTSLSTGAETWLSELIWREFYQHLIYFEPKLCKHHGYLSWEKHLKWTGKLDHFKQWCEGKTGYPIVDAAMRQLNTKGWMHNRLRMVVASFLTKDLHIDWRLGEQYFMTQLIDGDFAANNGGWQWCASTGCDGQPYFRIFNPISQGEKFDANGEFIRTWIPELNSVPNKFIHKPWLWNEFENVDYPQPIVDHKIQRDITLALYKDAKDQH
ncbi:deoxyribodipyrimidine photolyase [Vibrio mediterranei AK1]|uniref:deoxyribodipyrimidine photo-lyase n=1 Tax=Vibrio mediterranei TaxID=689 RepID=UPI0001540BD0|nr:deoxyribodipyrimidine photo-lyase [Vibrio mediterranei]EDL55914.1 deoxyribodipyrimidine photolyase [Vibrio mediterranei AK1]